MANAIQIKRRSSSGSTGAPSASALKWGELAFNEADNTLYYGYGSGNDQALSVYSIGGSGAYSLRDGTNATGVWPISINGNAATVTSGVTYTGTPTAGYIPKFTDSDTIENGYQISSNLSIDNSSAFIPRADAVKNYVDALKQGLDIKDSVKVATTTSLGQFSFSNNRITSLEDVRLPDIDGVTLNNGDRLLVKNDAQYNGIYIVDGVGEDNESPWTLDRADDALNSSQVTPGMFMFVEEGSINGDTGWVLTTNESINLNTTSLTFSQFSAAGQIYDGSGLYKDGNIIHVGTASSSRIVINADNIDLATVNRTDDSSSPVGITFPKVITTDIYGRVTGVSSGVVQNASTTIKGIAQFNSNNFTTNLGVVDLKNVVNTTGNQLISGVKTFANQPLFNSGLALPHAQGSVKVYSNVTNSDNSNIYFDTDDSDLHVAYKETLSSTTFTAGSGLIGGGTLGGNRIFHVGSGDGIIVDADTVAVDATVIRTTGDQTICGPKTFGGSDLDHYILNIESSANGSGIISFSEPTVRMYLVFDGLNNELRLQEFAANDAHKFNITTYTKLRASGTASAASHIPVFVSDPTNTSQTLYYKTPAQLLGDIGSVSTSRTLTAGSGLAGGGDLSVDRTFDIKTGYGIDIVSDAVAVDTGEVVVTTGVQTILGVKTFSNRPVCNSGITTLAVPTSSNNVEYFAVFDNDPSGTAQILKSVSKSDVLDDIGGASSGISMTAGSGLVGGGNLSESRTFDIGQGNGITVSENSIAVNAGSGLTADANGVHIGVNGGLTLNNDSIAVDSTVVRTTGNQTIGDIKYFNQAIILPTGTNPGTRPTLRIGLEDNYYYDFYTGVGSSTSGYLLAGLHSDTSTAPFRVVINNNAGTSSITNGTWDATTIAVNRGGTGQTSYTDGQLLIGNSTGNTLTKATLTSGNAIDIVNGNGSITISHADTSTLTGSQGSDGIASISLDGFGHITSVTTATYLTAGTVCAAIANCTIDGGTF